MLKRKAEREMQRAEGIAVARVEIVRVFEADRANDRAPVKSATGRIENGVERIMLDAPGFTKGIGEQDQRPFGGERMFEFHAGQRNGLRADNMACFVFRGRFALLITTNGTGAARKEAFVERKIIAGTAEGDCRAVRQAQVQPAPATRSLVPGRGDFQSLKIDVAAQVASGRFKVAEDLIAAM